MTGPEQLNEEVATPNLPNEELPGETPEAAECASEENVTRESLLKTIEMIVADDSEIVADDVARIKQQFYTLHNELTLRRKDEAVAKRAKHSLTPKIRSKNGSRLPLPPSKRRKRVREPK